LTWHVHGNYLYYLTQVEHEFFLPVKPGRPEGYGGRGERFAWRHNVHEVAAEEVRRLDIDVVIFQSRRNYAIDQHEILSEAQKNLPRIYLEHDPPREHPTDTRHFVDDPSVLTIHVTPFNQLMWDNDGAPTMVIEHGVLVPDDVGYTGELDRGLVVVNGMNWRGRRVGVDVFERVRKEIPLDLVGMGSEELAGLGDLPPRSLVELECRYRFVFNPIRYTSLGLAVCEAMMLGIPIVGLATTEMATAVVNGVSGYVDTDVHRLIVRMRRLIEDRELAARLGKGARAAAERRFDIGRFVRDWDRALQSAARRIPAG
jgi:glycosyltransferase involved in cell wall biosynthesis